MEIFNIPRFKNLISATVIFLIFILLGFWIYNTLIFRLVSTDPVMGNFPVSASFIKLKFNKSISSSIKVTGTEGLISSQTVNGSILTVLINYPLDFGKTYQLNVSDIISIGGQKLNDQSFEFTPKALPDSSLSADQKQSLVKNQQQYNALMNDPVISLLPFKAGGGDFSVSYTLDYSNHVTKATIVITAPTQAGQDAGLNWLKQIGADVTKYQITYSTQAVQ